jgi:hypothetical protein
MSLAPIILFTYNRPEHTKITLEHLKNNVFADQSTLYIYCDGAKEGANEETLQKIQEVRTVIREQQWTKEVRIVEAEKNKGLAESVINGVNEMVKKYGKVIVLEDDLLTGKYFLKFMNEALQRYKNHEEVMQISGYSFTANTLSVNNEAFFLPMTTTWGWATWKRVWDEIDFDCKDYHVLLTDKKLSRKFDLGGAYPYKKMFLQQMQNSNRVSSWGIRFYWSVFKKEGLVLYPDYSLVKNLGWDGSGYHRDNYEVFPLKNWNKDFSVQKYPNEVKTDIEKNKKIKKYIYKRTNIFSKIKFKVLFFSK